MLRDTDYLIHDGTPEAVTHDPAHGRGAVPRDWSVQPREMFDPPDKAVRIDRAEWVERIRDRVANGAQLSDVRLRGNGGQPIPSLQQGSWGYCWAHSTTQSVIVSRAVANMPYVPLSAFACAATIKRGANQGGWGALSAQWIGEHGLPSQQLWPQGDAGYAKYQSRTDVWEDAARHRITEDWADVTAQVYDRNISFDLIVSMLLTNTCGPGDFNWWSHSVCLLDPVDGNASRDTLRLDTGKLATPAEAALVLGLDHPVTGGIGVRIWNSWGDSWGDRGMGVLTGSKAIPDGCVMTRFTTAS